MRSNAACWSGSVVPPPRECTVDPKRDRSKVPPTLRVDPGGIPDELKDLSQWLRWRWVWDPKAERWTKLPIHATRDTHAATNDPTTWGRFEDAFGYLDTHRVHGVGFVFTDGDPYCGIDIDGCRNPDTGEIDERATRIVRTFRSWTEVSPTGGGLHIVVKAVLPGGAGHNRNGLEIYFRGRYFTMTGHVFGGDRAN